MQCVHEWRIELGYARSVQVATKADGGYDIDDRASYSPEKVKRLSFLDVCVNVIAHGIDLKAS